MLLIILKCKNFYENLSSDDFILIYLYFNNESRERKGLWYGNIFVNEVQQKE